MSGRPAAENGRSTCGRLNRRVCLRAAPPGTHRAVAACRPRGQTTGTQRRHAACSPRRDHRTASRPVPTTRLSRRVLGEPLRAALRNRRLPGARPCSLSRQQRSCKAVLSLRSAPGTPRGTPPGARIGQRAPTNRLRPPTAAQPSALHDRALSAVARTRRASRPNRPTACRSHRRRGPAISTRSKWVSASRRGRWKMRRRALRHHRLSAQRAPAQACPR